jgi:hypothetical protein
VVRILFLIIQPDDGMPLISISNGIPVQVRAANTATST